MERKISKIIRCYLLLVALWVKCFSSLCFPVLFQIFYNRYVLGKTVLCMQSFDPHLATKEWALNRNTSLPRHSILSGCAGLSTICESIFPCFRLNLCSFAQLKHVHHMVPGQPCCYMFPFGEGTGSFILLHKRNVSKSIALHQPYWYTHKYEWSKQIN